MTRRLWWITAVTVACVAVYASGKDLLLRQQVLCEVRDGSLKLQIVRYRNYGSLIGRLVLPVHAQSDRGYSLDNHVIMVSDRWRIAKTLLNSNVNYADQVCVGSAIKADIVLVFPLETDPKTYRSSHHNGMLASFDGGQHFNLVAVPELGSPFLLNQAGRSLIYAINGWVTEHVAIDANTLRAYQVAFLNESFPTMVASYRSPEVADVTLLTSALFAGLLAHINSSRPCPECKPMLFRELATSDQGRSWSLGRFGIEPGQALPADAQPLINGRRYVAAAEERTDVGDGRIRSSGE